MNEYTGWIAALVVLTLMVVDTVMRIRANRKLHKKEFARPNYILWAYPTNQSQRIHIWGKFDGLIQSACGLEMPDGHRFANRLPSSRKYPLSEPRCKVCASVWMIERNKDE